MSIKKFSLKDHFKWKLLLLRFLANAVTLLLVAVLVPYINFVNKGLLSLFLVAIGLGLINAFIKPVIQFVMLPCLFASYGLVLVLINAFILWLLSVIFANRFEVSSIFWALVGGVVMGLVSSFLESLFGITAPIVPDEKAAKPEKKALTAVTQLALAVEPKIAGSLGQAPMPDPDAAMAGKRAAGEEQ